MMDFDDDWCGPLSADDLDALELEVRAAQTAALAALPGELQASFEAHNGVGWCAENPEMFAAAVALATEAFKRIAAANWEHFHEVRQAGFPPLH